jgi:hypothetical protein
MTTIKISDEERFKLATQLAQSIIISKGRHKTGSQVADDIVNCFHSINLALDKNQ